MGGKTYKGLMIRETAENQFARAIEELSTDQLPAGDVLVKVLFSSLNYKDMLSAGGNRGVTKKYPHPRHRRGGHRRRKRFARLQSRR